MSARYFKVVLLRLLRTRSIAPTNLSASPHLINLSAFTCSTSAVISFALGQRSIAVFTEFVEKLQVEEPANLLRLSVIRTEASGAPFLSFPPLLLALQSNLTLCVL
jgi:hypothetical protein